MQAELVATYTLHALALATALSACSESERNPVERTPDAGGADTTADAGRADAAGDGGSADTTGDAGSAAVDAGDGGPAESAALRALRESCETWAALQQQHGSTYWYEEQNCGAGGTTAMVVQVVDGQVESSTRESPTQCDDGAVFRYAEFVAVPFEELCAQCERVLEMDHEGRDAEWQSPVFETDDAGVVTTCKSRANGCFDACDEGFYVSKWGFGRQD